MLFALRAGTIAEGERFSVMSREGALVINNVALSALLGVVLLGTLYPLLTEAFDVKVSVGPPYFNPVGAIFFLPMLLVLVVGPLLRWRRDSFARIRMPVIWRLRRSVRRHCSPSGCSPASRSCRCWGWRWPPWLRWRASCRCAGVRCAACRWRCGAWCIAHFGVAVALFGMSADSAFTQERLVAARGRRQGPGRAVDA